jgi:hypothetical protein
VDVAAAELTFLKSVGLAHRRLDPMASLDVLDARSGVTLALQLPFIEVSESMGNHDSKIVDAASVD